MQISVHISNFCSFFIWSAFSELPYHFHCPMFYRRQIYFQIHADDEKCEWFIRETNIDSESTQSNELSFTHNFIEIGPIIKWAVKHLQFKHHFNQTVLLAATAMCECLVSHSTIVISQPFQTIKHGVHCYFGNHNNHKNVKKIIFKYNQ